MKLVSLLILLTGLQVAGGFGVHITPKAKMPATVVQATAQDEVKDRFGDKKLVVITGSSSGLGRKTAAALLRTGQYHVVGAVRDIDKMDAVAEIDGFPEDSFTTMYCELNSFDSVREFCENLEEWKGEKPIDRLILNSGVYQPSLPYAKWSADGHEQTMQINFLSHFLMISLLMDGMKEAPDPRIITVGSVTGNDNTVGGGGVYPIADLKQLEGFKAGFNNPIAMADGYGFIGAKAYKDSKLCLMMLANILHARFNKSHGIAFSSIYPGCIAESPLFREKRAWFRKYFPIFMKYITGGFVGEEEAGQRLFQVAHDPRCAKSGVYWSWNGGPREGRGAEALEKDGQISGGGGAGGGWDSIFENEQSSKVQDVELSVDLFRCATEITGAKWPDPAPFASPCSTLKAVGAISKGMIADEETKRLAERPGFDANGNPINKVVKTKKVEAVVDEKPKVKGNILTRAVGRVTRPVRRIFGRVPKETLASSDEEEKPLEEPSPVTVSSDIKVEEEEIVVEEPVLPISEKDTEAFKAEISELLDRESIEKAGNEEVIEKALEKALSARLDTLADKETRERQVVAK